VIRIRDGDGVRRVTIDRPERRNALTPAALDDLAAAVEDPPTPVVAIRGAGPAFCAGADLDSVAAVARETVEGLEAGSDVGTGAGAGTGTGTGVGDERTDGDETGNGSDGDSDDGPESPAAAFARRGQRTAAAIESSPAVVVAGVDGAARGGGLELAAACDLRVATPDATFGEPGVTFGLFGAWGGTHRLRRVVGEGVAADLALSGRVLDAEAALRTGLVSRITDDPNAVAREVAGNDAAALERLKPLMRSRAPAGEQERDERTAFAALVAEQADSLVDRKG
jgi:enoyl-CoA hydratase/carnithine racemase